MLPNVAELNESLSPSRQAACNRLSISLNVRSNSRIKFQVAAADVRANIEPDTEVVGIDEARFFDNELIQVVNELAAQGKRVIVAGLDQDYTGKPWEPMPQLLAVAEYITKTHAICMKCGRPANYTQRTFESEERVAVGGEGMYEARCRQCFVPHADAPTIHDD
jgi:thymidine kinase